LIIKLQRTSKGFNRGDLTLGLMIIAQYVILQKYFSHPSWVIYFFQTPPMELKRGLQIGGKQLIATHLDQSNLSRLASVRLCCAFYQPQKIVQKCWAKTILLTCHVEGQNMSCFGPLHDMWHLLFYTEWELPQWLEMRNQQHKSCYEMEILVFRDHVPEHCSHLQEGTQWGIPMQWSPTVVFQLSFATSNIPPEACESPTVMYRPVSQFASWNFFNWRSSSVYE
jgi:hypothetical protein